MTPSFPEHHFDLLWTVTCGEKDVLDVAFRIKEAIASRPQFCLWLSGDLGSGKTTFTSELLHVLGLSKHVPVLSPTYTYMTEYDVGTRKIYHLDLYRLAEGDEDSLEGLLHGVVPWAMIVEWPEKAGNSSIISPDFWLKICFEESDTRNYKFFVRKA